MNKLSSKFTVFAIAASMLLASGCRNRGGIGNGNGNGNGNDNGSSGELTVEQEAAVNAVVEQLEATAKAVGGVVESFTGIDADGDGTFGDCPEVTAEFADGITEVEVNFGEGAGCESDYYNNIASGSVALTLDTVARDLEIVFNELTVDGVTTSGSASTSLTRDGQNNRTVAGSIDLTTSGVGTVQGELSIGINLAARTISVDQADLTVTDDDGNSYAVDVDGIFIDPIGNGNFIPQSGTITFEIPNEEAGPDTVTVVIEFDAQSPETGVVAVTVGSADPVDYELPN